MSLLAAATERPPMGIAESFAAMVVCVVICVSIAYVRVKGGARARKDLELATARLTFAEANATWFKDRLDEVTRERDNLRMPRPATDAKP